MHLIRFLSPFPKHLSRTEPLGALCSNSARVFTVFITSRAQSQMAWPSDPWFIFLYIVLKTSRLDFHSTTLSSPAPGKTTRDRWLFHASDVFVSAPSDGYFHFVRPVYSQLAFDIHLPQRIGMQRVIFIIDQSAFSFLVYFGLQKREHIEKSQFTTVQVLNCLLLLHRKRPIVNLFSQRLRKAETVHIWTARTSAWAQVLTNILITDPLSF